MEVFNKVENKKDTNVYIARLAVGRYMRFKIKLILQLGDSSIEYYFSNEKFSSKEKKEVPEKFLRDGCTEAEMCKYINDVKFVAFDPREDIRLSIGSNEQLIPPRKYWICKPVNNDSISKVKL